MSYTISDLEILNAVRSEINEKINEGLFSGSEVIKRHDQVNIDMIVKKYSRWSKNRSKCEKLIIDMFDEEFN